MKLNQIAAKPQLVKIDIDDEDVIKEFGESVEFWTYDRQPLDVFMKLASTRQDQPEKIIEVVRKLILDENGKEIIKDDIMLPTMLLMRSINKIVEKLGKF